MWKYFRPFCAIFAAICVFCFSSVSVFADDSSNPDDSKEYVPKSNFFHWAAFKAPLSPPMLFPIFGYTVGFVCPESEDGYHRASSYEEFKKPLVGDPYYYCICEYCGHGFSAYETDLKQSYEAQVSEMEDKYHTTTIDANGFSNVKLTGWTCIDSSPNIKVIEFNPDILSLYWTIVVGHSSSFEGKLMSPAFSVPVDGTCTVLFPSFTKYPSETSYRYYYLRFEYSDDDGETWKVFGSYPPSESNLQVDGELVTGEPYYFSFTATHLFKYRFIFIPYVWPKDLLGASAYFRAADYVYIQGVQAIPGGDMLSYSPTTRPTSITGNYGIIGDDGKLTQVTGNTIINETNNTYYNPATGQTVPITNWSYDYSDRSYTVTTEEGDSYTITYGDENVTIHEGDTVYNIYYVVNGSGSGEGGGEDPPPECEHSWTETSRTEPTCTVPGSVKSICSKCDEAKTDPIPALGHDWTTLRTVPTQYGEDGALIQEGYTLYECSRCGTQYKDADGAGPPSGGGSGSESGGSIWDKLKDLAGKLFGGIFEVIGSIVGALIDGLIALADKAVEGLSHLSEALFKALAEIPGMFGGFVDFINAVFPFLPPEIITILTFGVIALVLVAIIKKFID